MGERLGKGFYSVFYKRKFVGWDVLMGGSELWGGTLGAGGI